MQFKGKNIIITGASSGIGASLAKEFASKGARLFLLGRSEERLKAVASECEENAEYVKTYSVDMADMSSIDLFVENFKKDNDRLDVLILNAGISQRSKTFETSLAVDRMIMETDFFGPVYMTKKLESFIKNSDKFSLAVTSSISGLFGFPLRSSYCAAKHALFGFFETLELENPNVRVTFLIPGRINTPISKSAVLGDGSTHASMDPGQAKGMSSEKCARIAVRAIARGRHRKLIGGIELIMVYIKKLCPWLYFKIAGKISAI